MQEFSPFLWFDSKAEEAVAFYTSVLAGKVTGMLRYDAHSAKASGQPEGSVLTIDFELAGQRFTALNGGPVFHFTPAVSFFVCCESRAEIDTLWSRLSEGGAALMPLGEYPFAERYGWLNDRFGVSWQLMLGGGHGHQKISPALMFHGRIAHKAEEAMRFYTSIFPESAIVRVDRWGAGEPGREGTVKYATFRVLGHELKAMDSPVDHAFGVTSAISFVVHCDTQGEIDHLWSRLTDGGKESQCGWLEDRYGVAWQIVPRVLPRMLADPDPERAGRAMQAMLKMVKLEIAPLEKAYAG
jgi:predicted 3-demethylubiquinone-9 3-methyltransferase (glyoxalase superfamily)